MICKIINHLIPHVHVKVFPRAISLTINNNVRFISINPHQELPSVNDNTALSNKLYEQSKQTTSKSTCVFYYPLVKARCKTVPEFIKVINENDETIRENLNICKELYDDLLPLHDEILSMEIAKSFKLIVHLFLYLLSQNHHLTYTYTHTLIIRD